MMRVLMGVFWTVVLFVLWNQDGRGDPAVARSGDNQDWPRKVEGRGDDFKAAKNDALREAQKRIVACLRRHEPPLLSWVPAEEYIEKNLVRKGERGPDFLDTFKSWLLYLNDPDWDVFSRLDRESQEMERFARGKERLVILARVFAGLLVLLAAVAGCIRVDEWTRGAYRRWLQLAGASLVAAAWAGLWLMF